MHTDLWSNAVWNLTWHARTRMSEMQLNDDEVLDALRNPELTYPSSSRFRNGADIAVRGRLAIVFDPATGAVVTVLWRGLESRDPIPQRSAA
jgi:hypothetical protein